MHKKMRQFTVALKLVLDAQKLLRLLAFWEVVFPDAEVPPDLPGVGEHLPDIPEPDPSERRDPGEIQLDRHLDELRLFLRSESQKLDVKSVSVDPS